MSINIQYFERSSFVTPINSLFINVPIKGEITAIPKFHVPDNRAKMVPSILDGVILANSENIGINKSNVVKNEKTVSVKSKITISGIPTLRFHLLAKIKSKHAPI